MSTRNHLPLRVSLLATDHAHLHSIRSLRRGHQRSEKPSRSLDGEDYKIGNNATESMRDLSQCRQIYHESARRNLSLGACLEKEAVFQHTTRFSWLVPGHGNCLHYIHHPIKSDSDLSHDRRTLVGFFRHG